MTWSGSTNPSPLDRIFAALPYLLPLIDGLLFFSNPFFSQFPVLAILFVPLAPLITLYRGFPLMGLIIFFALFLLVVRNERISRFIRFNTMQAIMLDIVLFLCNIIVDFLVRPIFGGQGLIYETILNVIFLGTVAAVVYSVAQSLLGRYAEIPTISNAVHMQVR